MSIPRLKHKLRIDWKSAQREALRNKVVPPGKRRQKKYKNLLTYSYLHSGVLLEMIDGPLEHTVMPGLDLDGFGACNDIAGPFQTPWHESMFQSHKNSEEMGTFYNKMVGYLKGSRRFQRSNLKRRKMYSRASRVNYISGVAVPVHRKKTKKAKVLQFSVSRGNRGKQDKRKLLWKIKKK